MTGRVTVVGGGLAGCEAAWQAARTGAQVTLYEMRPHRSGPAHTSGRLAELVCSNSLRGAALTNAVGLLKEELALLDSVIIAAAREAAVPAGGALAVDRERFSNGVESRIAAEPLITVKREEARAIGSELPVVVACGPLPSEEFLAEIDGLVRAAGGAGRLHYFDAAAPIVATDSLDLSQMYAKSRYDKGEGEDYLNIPLDRERYAALVRDLRTLPRREPEAFEEARYFEGCLPVEEMADRGEETLRFGPLKPVGLRDPRTGQAPYAVVQLRKENAQGSAYNLVGFQTRLTWPAQREAFGRLPGLQNAEWLRLGVMHRNTFLDSPRLLDAQPGTARAGWDLLRRSDHRCRRIRRGGRLRRDGRHPCGSIPRRIGAGAVPAGDRVGSGDRAPAERADARFPAVQRHVGRLSGARGREAGKRRTPAPDGRARPGSAGCVRERNPLQVFGVLLDASMKIRSTTIVAVRRDGALAMAGDGQVTLDKTIVKHGARKVRKIAGGKVLAGFAGSAADGITLLEKFEAKYGEFKDLRRAAVELAKDWRQDRALRRLEALMIVGSPEHLFVLSGSGDVIEPDEGIAAIGSGGPYAQAAAAALLRNTDVDAAGIARKALEIASEICIYTNADVVVESLP